MLSSSLFYHLFADGASAVEDRLGLPFFFGLLPGFRPRWSTSSSASTVLTSHSVGEADPNIVPSRLSKRAARRIIQRAFVLAGRDRNVRQHIREAEVTSLWIIEDWHLTWTLLVHRGRVEFDRHPTRKPDLTLTWRTAEDFFKESEAGERSQDLSQMTGNLALRRFTEPVCQAFWVSLREVLRNPVDGSGDPLV